VTRFKTVADLREIRADCHTDALRTASGVTANVNQQPCRGGLPPSHAFAIADQCDSSFGVRCEAPLWRGFLGWPQPPRSPNAALSHSAPVSRRMCGGASLTRKESYTLLR
jgi:hypothetical protein